MDRVFQMLMDEHRVIERITSALGRLAAMLKEGATPEPDATGEVIDLMRRCTDGYHHGKEEKLLFPALTCQDRYRLSVPVGVLLGEHDMGRGHLRALAAAAGQGLGGGGSAPASFRAHAAAYAQLLRAHISKEDGGLFPTADRALGAAAKDDLWRRFQEFEAGVADRLGDYRARVGALEDGVAPVAVVR